MLRQRHAPLHALHRHTNQLPVNCASLLAACITQQQKLRIRVFDFIFFVANIDRVINGQKVRVYESGTTICVCVDGRRILAREMTCLCNVEIMCMLNGEKY